MGGGALGMVRHRCIVALACLAALSLLAYFPALSLPRISDTYLQIQLGRQWGPVDAWGDLFKDPLYRCRATSIIFTWWLEKLFGMNQPLLNWGQLVLHIFAVWLVYALGALRQIGWRLSFVAAAFFAVYEGHQEAVIWFAAVPETLVFLFLVAGLLCWMLWLQEERPRWTWLAAAVLCFPLALLSKESAAVAPALVLGTVVLYPARRRPILIATVISSAIALLYAVLIFQAGSSHLHLNDGTFSLKANFPLTIANSTGRLFWFWGLLAIAVLIRLRCRNYRNLVLACGVWILLTFLPYSFLLYMPRVPSRHTYLASAGLALVAGAGFLAFRDKIGARYTWAPAALAAIVVLHNCAYLWTKKQDQYIERAEATERLVKLGKAHKGPIYLKCFPYPPVLAVLVLEQETGRSADQVILDAARKTADTAEFCYEGN
jgi:hypothetical protein